MDPEIETVLATFAAELNALEERMKQQREAHTRLQAELIRNRRALEELKARVQQRARYLTATTSRSGRSA